jgi:hypothetical protein
VQSTTLPSETHALRNACAPKRMPSETHTPGADCSGRAHESLCLSDINALIASSAARARG